MSQDKQRKSRYRNHKPRGGSPANYKGQLQRLCKQLARKKPRFVRGQIRDAGFLVQVFLNGKLIGEAQAASKKIAEQYAARNAFIRLKASPLPSQFVD